MFWRGRGGLPVPFEFNGLIGAVAVGLVLAALATLIALAVRAVRRKRSGAKDAAAPASPAPVDARALAAALERAEETNDKTRLASLHLALARAHLADGRRREAADSLRRSIVVASEAGQHESHALARLELGDLALADGDLTSACEHWQIARSLFQSLQQASRCAETEARMKETRCPTDWVLNEF